MIDSHAERLHELDPKTATRYTGMLAEDREACLAEAVVYDVLDGLNLQPRIIDLLGTGGADFECCPSSGPLFLRHTEARFVVEATSLALNAISERSGMSDAYTAQAGGAFNLITRNVRQKASAKADQLARHKMPRVLAIVSTHNDVGTLFSTAAAEYMLTSDSHLRVGINDAGLSVTECTGLEESVFFRKGQDGQIEMCRQSISAILLIGVAHRQSNVLGILHPQATYPLNIRAFAEVPFVRVSTWPPANGEIQTEWVVGTPSAYRAYHFPLEMDQR